MRLKIRRTIRLKSKCTIDYMSENLKSVLWVEENILRTLDLKNKAKEYGLNLIVYNCWDDAFAALSSNFDEWSAIILQPNSKLHPGSYCNIMQFLPQAFTDIAVLCSVKGKCLPWYLLTESEPHDFKDMVLESRTDFDGGWLQGYYDIESEEQVNYLFTRIKQYTQQSERHQVRIGQYKNVYTALEYLEYHHLNSKVRGLIEDMLISLCFGSNTPSGIGDIRIIIEYLFHSMVKNNILPHNLTNTMGKLNINACTRILSGMETTVDDIKYSCTTSIMSKIMSNNIYSMLNTSKTEHHANTEASGQELDLYLYQVGTKNLLHSYAIQLCDIIIWYHKLLKSVEEMPNGEMPIWWTESQI